MASYASVGKSVGIDKPIVERTGFMLTLFLSHRVLHCPWFVCATDHEQWIANIYKLEKNSVLTYHIKKFFVNSRSGFECEQDKMLQSIEVFTLGLSRKPVLAVNFF